jgi:DNA-binding response OmpR family regulator
MAEDNSSTSILIVDDERDVADGYITRLSGQYDDVEAVYNGADAIEYLDEHSVDVLLLDRRMPGMTGDEVLDKIEARGFDCRVIMLTAVDPDFDIVDMPFDDYFQKPVETEDLIAGIEQQLRAQSFDSELEQYFRTSAKIAVLESEKPEAQLESNKKYQRLKEQAERLDDELEQRIEELDDYIEAFSSIDRQS